ncbi:MAG: hypothetical protein EAZ55_10760 [Cytophagales bacterium]|nr:MAG: hypothetical protein EAZ55_10760 [Cytophagales bacterium]
MPATPEECAIVAALIAENLKTQNPTLDLGNCGLNGTEPELQALSECTHLHTLIFSNKWLEYEEETQKWVESQNKGNKNKLTSLPALPTQVNKLIAAGAYENEFEISDFSPLQSLAQLQTLNLGYNQIIDIAPLQSLTQLQRLELRRNQISDIAPLQSLQQLQTLDLSYNQIIDIAPLQSLTQLQTLYLSINQISDIASLQSLAQLQTLNLHNNKISDIAPLQSLTQLQTLNLHNNKISDIAPLQSLTQLQTLELWNNQIRDIAPLQSLTQLQTLNLERNQISDIAPLQSLTQLQTLNLERNQISDIAPLKELQQLQTLYLSGNQISDIAPLQSLTQLQTVNLSGNQISNISFLQDLTKLQSLNLTSNKIITRGSFNEYKNAMYLLQSLIKKENIEGKFNFAIIEKDSPHKYIQVKASTFLLSNPDIGRHLLPMFSINNPLLNICRDIVNKGFFELELKITDGLPKNLKELSLLNNYISDTKFLQGLTKLQTLDLSENQIRDISLAFLRSFPQLKELKLHKNPIGNIPKEVFDKGYKNVLETVRNYLEDKEKGASKNNRLKVIVIGNGSVGKTQTTGRWREGKNFVFDTQHNSTHGIVLLDKPLGEVALQLWDFAGQDIYHATHRLFMQSRAIFFLVWDAENEFEKKHHEHNGVQYKNETLDYWLEYAYHFGQGSPVLVLQNKADTEEAEDKTYLKKDINSFKEKYPILDFLQISAKENIGFRQMDKVLQKAFQENDILRQQLEQELPDAWLWVRSEIEKLQTAGEKTLSVAAFEQYCEETKMHSNFWEVLNYLHNNGTLYYRSGYFQDQIILNQDWAIQAIYKVLDRESEHYKELKRAEGKLSYDYITEIWQEHTDKEREIFMDFMLSAELCFETTANKEWDTPLSERSFVVPQLLRSNKPKQVSFYEEDLELKQEISYRFLPKVFIERLIVLANRFSEVEYMWANGLYLSTKQGNAVVEAIYEQKIIRIQTNSDLVIQKISEELAQIANEGKIKAQSSEYKFTTETEKYFEKLYGLKGLQPITIQSIKDLFSKGGDSDMEKAIEQGLQFAQKDETSKSIIESIKAEFGRFKKDKLKDILDYDDERKAMAKITDRFFGALDEAGKAQL